MKFTQKYQVWWRGNAKDENFGRVYYCKNYATYKKALSMANGDASRITKRVEFEITEKQDSYTQGYKDALEKVLEELSETITSDHAHLGMYHMKVFITNLLNDK